MNGINEQKQEEIRKQAKQIIDNFTEALEKVKVKPTKAKKELGGLREENDGENSDQSFRKIMFKNAPHKNNDNILAETKSW